MDKKLYRSKEDKKFTGLCGGIAEYFNIDSSIIRILFVLPIFFAGTSLMFTIMLYATLSFIVPERPLNTGRYKPKYSKEEGDGESSFTKENVDEDK